MRKLLLFAFLISGCQYEGTGTGNPMQQSNQSPPSGAERARSVICRKLTACHTDLRPAVCYDAVWIQSGVASKLGAQAPIDTLKDSDSAESKDTLAFDETVLNQCENSITALDCASQTVQDAYQSGASEPFALLPAMIPSVCGQVYPP